MIPLPVRISGLAALASALALFACSDGSEPPAPPSATPLVAPPETPPAVPPEVPPVPDTGGASRGERQYAALCAWIRRLQLL